MVMLRTKFELPKPDKEERRIFGKLALLAVPMRERISGRERPNCYWDILSCALLNLC